MSQSKGKAWVTTRERNGKTVHICRYSYPDPSTVKGYRQKDITCHDVNDAHEQRIKMQARIDSGEFDPKPYTFGEAAKRWINQQRYKQITKEKYGSIMRNVLTAYRDMPLRDVAQMRQELTDLIFDSSYSRELKVILSGTCDLAMAEGKIEGHRLGLLPTAPIPSRTRPLIAHTPEQLNVILDNMPDYMVLAVLLGRGCGLRLGEIMAMETDAIFDGYLQVKRSTSGGFDGTPKKRYEGFTPRVVPIPYWLTPEIEKHVATFTRDERLFWPRRPMVGRYASSRYASPQVLNRHLKVGAAKAGLPTEFTRGSARLNFTSHQLRKNYATQLRDESQELGIQWPDIKQWLGHKDLTADVYASQGADVLIRGRNLSDPRK